MFGGVLVGLAVLALIVVGIVSWRRKAQGRPMSFNDGLRSFGLTLSSIVLILVSSSIAFFATCLPIGLMGLSGYTSSTETLAFVVGGLSAVVVGALVAYGLKRGRDKRAKKRKLEDL